LETLATINIEKLKEQRRKLDRQTRITFRCFLCITLSGVHY